ncbi:CHAT domain-containing protein [Streptomyces sp. NPDC002589]|uniref:CHAT domain-containing protein n=1 Tax=Streptomyces sp. NPDC002589 TaxID=3154420 RepID=UPI00332FC4FE
MSFPNRPPGGAEDFRRGNEMFLRYERTRRPADLDRAVDAYLRAVGSDSTRTAWWRNLAVALLRRFTSTGSVDACDQAIAALGSAMDTTGADPLVSADLWQMLGLAWNARFEETADLSSLDESIKAYRNSLNPGAPDPTTLQYLSSAVWHRFERTGQPSALEAAVTMYHEAIAAFPEGHPEFGALLENAGIALRTRFEHTSRPEDLTEAISLARRSAAVTAPDDPRLFARLVNLAGALMYRFELLPEMALLNEAIASFQSAAESLPDGHTERAGVLSNLAGALLTRAWRLDDAGDLDLAIDLFREATSLPEGGCHLVNLASALTMRYKRTREHRDLNEAIAVGRRAVADDGSGPQLDVLASALLLRAAPDGASDALDEATDLLRRCLARTPEGSPLRAHSLLSLGRALEKRSPVSAEARDSYRQAASIPRAPVHLRIEAALSRSRIGGAVQDWTEAAAGAELAVELLPHVARQDLTRIDQEYGLGRWGGIAAHAAACALQLGDGRRALRLLEQGRGILLSRVLGDEDTESAEATPLDGTVVLINTTHLRSDALILTPEGVSSVALPDFTDIATHLARFVGAVEAGGGRHGLRERQRAQQVIHAELAWLWDTVTGPVLDHLGLTGRPEDGGKWPRIWWARASLLADLPLHAAGHHDERDAPHPRTVMDRVVSSYTPTVRMLRRLRAASTGPVTDPRLLVVAVPEAAGAPTLPGVLQEAASLAELTSVDLIVGGRATHAAVEAALETRAFVHFACHGVSDPDEPSSSRLLLHDRPLTVLDLSKLNLTGAKLAYLSACETSRVALELADEAIHITTAFQLAGYPQVIGTLWRIEDTLAREVAESVYRALHAAGFDPSRTAFALHTEVRALRDRYVRTPSLWAAHIHAGA